MKDMVELLAPAGNSEALHAAVENGADAVYLGGKLFNARQQANNFDMQELREELRYAHARGVSIYLTLNTLLHDDEIPQALIYANEACNAGIDGIIVQDIGLAAELRSRFPGLPLHGSTQMTVYDIEGVRVLEEMGFQRVVLARELTLEQASQIARSTSLEVEMFVHGALCVCYSGQCFMSSIIGGRSGNRGRCAQPCRLTYTLAETGRSSGGGLRSGTENKYTHRAGGVRKGRGREVWDDPETRPRYLMSPKDINSLEYLAEIAASGIRSLKIEGRMKSAEYVATVVRIYRKYLDMGLEQVNKGITTKLSIDEKDWHDLLQIFNRGGFSSGYLKGKTGADMMSYEKPNNSGVYIGDVISFDTRQQTMKIKLEDGISIGDGIEIWTGRSESPGGIISSIRSDGRNVKREEKGRLAEIGHFKGRISPGRKVYKTTDAQLIKAARESYSGRKMKRIDIKGNAVLKLGCPLMFIVTDGDGHKVSSEGTVLPERALHKPLTGERLREQLQKTGATPFSFSELKIDLQGELSIPISEINDVRRKALDLLYDARAEKYAQGRCKDVYLSGGTGNDFLEFGNSTDVRSVTENDSVQNTNVAVKKKKPLISVYMYNWEKGSVLSSFGADRLYLPFSALGRSGFGEAAEAARRSGAEVFCWLPSVTRGNYEHLIDRFIDDIVQKKSNGSGAIEGILAANIGTVRKLSSVRGIRLAGDISLNLFNAFSVRKAAGFGLESAALSVEMNISQIYEMMGNLKIALHTAAETAQQGVPVQPAMEAAVYGRLPLMISEYCPVGSVAGGCNSSSKCSGCCSNGSYSLKDRLGKDFPVLCDNIDCRSTLLNSNVLFVPDSLKNLADAGINIFRLYIWDEEPDIIKDMVSLYRAAASCDSKAAAAYGGLAERIKASGFTKGHYYRGV